MRTFIGDWVIFIGSSKPSSGTMHLVINSDDGLVRAACGLERAAPEVLDRTRLDTRSVPPGCCRRCITWQAARTCDPLPF